MSVYSLLFFDEPENIITEKKKVIQDMWDRSLSAEIAVGVWTMANEGFIYRNYYKVLEFCSLKEHLSKDLSFTGVRFRETG